MSRFPLVAPLVVALVVACSGSGAEPAETTSEVGEPPATTEPRTTTTLMSPDAAAYLAHAVELMRRHSINSEVVDWDSLETAAYQAAAGAETPEDTYPAIALALGRLEDGHSLFLAPDEADTFSHGEARYVEPVVEVAGDGIGRVLVSRYIGDVGPQADQYATDLANRLNEISSDVCGWILNLQVNGGGNMWAMLGGLAPLLTLGEVGSFTYPDGLSESWVNEGDRVRWGDETMAVNSVERAEDDLRPVAVLIGSGTASSGEAVAVAFRGQRGIRFFGQATSGLTTSNEPIELDDGALLILTMSVFTDRTELQFGQGVPVEPDETARSPQEAEDLATQWLLSRPECSG